ncbi:MAG: hypothetical protein ACOZAA_07370 [Pseudomonadota bacterium]
MMRRILRMLAVLGAASCASTKNADVSASVVGPASGEGELVVGALADSALPGGECGMILWTLEAAQPTPIFRFIAGKGGEVALNGKLVKLSVVESSGASGFGVFEEQTYIADGLKASVKVRFGLGFEGGSYLEQGILSIESGTGWRSVIPAAGIAGCRGK